METYHFISSSNLPGFVWNPGLIVRGRVIGFDLPQPSSGVSNRPRIGLITTVCLSNDFVSTRRFVGQQIIGSLVVVQIAFDCRIYRMYDSSLWLTSRTKFFNIIGHCFMFRQTPSIPFGSRQYVAAAAVAFERDTLLAIPVYRKMLII